MGLALLVELVVCLWALIDIWPVITATTTHANPSPQAWSPFGLFTWNVTGGAAIIFVVVLSSALGSFVHSASTFVVTAGNGRLDLNWIWWYVLRGAIGVALAMLVFFALRGGLFPEASGQSVNPYGFAGIAGLCGLFSEQATQKLRGLFEAVLPGTSPETSSAAAAGTSDEKP